MNFDVLALCNGWQIISPSKSFTVYAATAMEKSEWMAHINKCVQDLLTKRKISIFFLLLHYNKQVDLINKETLKNILYILLLMLS